MFFAIPTLHELYQVISKQEMERKLMRIFACRRLIIFQVAKNGHWQFVVGIAVSALGQ